MSCGTFLADFVTDLSWTYQKNCLGQALDAHDFCPRVYETSVETCLKMFVDETRDAHGRLLGMKHTLLTIGGEHEIKSEHLEFYFYAKDVEVYRGRTGEKTTVAEKIDLLDVSDVSVSQILKHRRQFSIYQQTENVLQVAAPSGKKKLNFIKSSS